jgi:hypothetical protein
VTPQTSCAARQESQANEKKEISCFGMACAQHSLLGGINAAAQI